MDSRTDMHGRRVIYTDATDITAENIREVVEKAMDTHRSNSSDIDYLYRYYKGEQPILSRKKTVRPEICNKIIINIAIRAANTFTYVFIVQIPFL